MCKPDLFVAKNTRSGTPSAKNLTVSVPSYQSFAVLFFVPPVAQADTKKPKTATRAKFLIFINDIYPLKI